MARQLNATIGEYENYGLITDTQPRKITRGVVLDGSEQKTFKRGTLLSIPTEADGKLKPFEAEGEGEPDSILTDDVTVTEEDSEGVTVTVYYQGCFDPAKVLDKDGKPVQLKAEDLNTLRMKGILFKGAVPFIVGGTTDE